MTLDRFFLSLCLMSFSVMGCQFKKVRSTAASATSSAPALESRYTRLADTTQEELAGTPILTTKQIRDHLLALGDSNKDELLSDAEKAALHEHWDEVEAELKAWIKAQLDADGDGIVNDEDIQKSLKKLRRTIQAEREAILDEMNDLQREASAEIIDICQIEDKYPDDQTSSSHEHSSFRSEDCDDKLPDIDDLLSQCSVADSSAAQAVADSLEKKLEVLQDELDEFNIILIGIEKKCG